MTLAPQIVRDGVVNIVGRNPIFRRRPEMDIVCPRRLSSNRFYRPGRKLLCPQ
jgi:hypothetical protein